MTSALSDRVCRRFLARDFPNEKALEKYLHEHPHAEKTKHHVTKQKEQGKKDHGKKDEGHGGKGHGEEHDQGEHDEEEHDEGSMLSRLKGALKAVAHQLKGAPAEAQKFVADPKHRKEALHKGVEALKKAPRKYVTQLVKTAKHEVHEFKTAGQGLAAVMKGDKPSAAQKKAIKAVAVHMAITIAAGVLTTATPALAAMAIGKALGKHVAVKAAAAVLGDLHLLEEWGHIGHGAHESLEGFMEFIKLGAQSGGKGEKVKPEDALVGLVMKHVSKTIEDLDDDTLAEGLGGAEKQKGQDKKSASRIARLYYDRHTAGWARVARPKLSPWGGEDHEWPVVSPSWDEEPVRSDRFHDVFVMRYVDFGLAGSPMVTVDTTPWTHHNKPEFTYLIQVFDEKVKAGKIPLEGYERSIPKLLNEALEFAQHEVARFVKQLDQLKVTHWDIEYDKRADDLIVQYQDPGLSDYSDSSMSGTFYGPLAIFTGGKSDYDISYSEGADYEGHFGQRELRGEVRSLEEIEKVLRDAERLWAKAEKQKADHST